MNSFFEWKFSGKQVLQKELGRSVLNITESYGFPNTVSHITNLYMRKYNK